VRARKARLEVRMLVRVGAQVASLPQGAVERRGLLVGGSWPAGWR